MTGPRLKDSLACDLVSTFFAVVACEGLLDDGSSPDLEFQESRDDWDLIALFQDWCDFHNPTVRDGVPDYTPSAMAAQFEELPQWKTRLAAIDPSEWPISEQVDYQLVGPEMNGLEFAPRFQRPWAEMSSYYKVIRWELTGLEDEIDRLWSDL